MQRNVERDGEQNKALESADWTVIRIWEHEDPDAVAALVSDRAVIAHSAGGVELKICGRSQHPKAVFKHNFDNHVRCIGL